jgi:hypothetical protein
MDAKQKIEYMAAQVKSLREGQQYDYVSGNGRDMSTAMDDAADSIEELLKLIAARDAEIERMREALHGENGALTRMDRARYILANGNNWLMLDTSDIRAALTTQPKEQS